ncbi:MAG: YlbF family regulator [Phycisphaerales bacterium]|nr:YlbF family regulator [Phycisphaerales bacterium]
MPELDDVLKQARAVGDLIAGLPAVRAYFEAARRIESDAGARQLLSDYQREAHALREREMSGRPVEVADKQRFAAMEAKVAGHDLVKAFSRAQADYVELMERVTRAMHEPLATIAEQAHESTR